MYTSVSMLRGINVSGQRKVPMEELRRCCESLGFGKVRTYMQSGNVVVEHQRMRATDLVERIERGIKASFGFEVRVIIRTREEMLSVIKNTPFTQQEEARVYVTFLSAKPMI